MKIRKPRKPKVFNPRPKIEYPPVPTRTWVPPDQRPPKKKPPPKYTKPAEMSVKLELSSLLKVWHNFIIYGDRAILAGNYSHYYKKYSIKTNGYQAPCVCVSAVAFSKLFEITGWSAHTLDKILDVGDSLYLRSITFIPEKYKKQLKISDVYHTYYIDNIKVTMDMKGKKYIGKLLPDLDNTPHLADVLKEFFETQQSGILHIGLRFFALFMVKKGYYFFDPNDHEKDGSQWNDLQGHGYSLLARVTTTVNLVPLVQENVHCVENPKFTLVPCNILRKFEINTRYPSCMEEANLELRFPPMVDKKVESKDDSKTAAVEEHVEENGAGEEDIEDVEGDDVPGEDDQSPQLDASDIEGGKGDALDKDKDRTEAAGTQTKKRSEARPPIEKVKAASVTYFIDLIPEKVGILRASTHQCDTKFTKYLGKQSIANAVAAVAMLRSFKSKYWTSNILDDVLRAGESVYHDSMKALRLSGDTTLKVTTVCKKISVNNNDYTPKIEDLSVIGKLNSQTDDMLDLLPALKEFLSDNDACILCGPITLAVWLENGLFYMFDPNERDEHGFVIVKQVQIGSLLKVYDVAPGVACLTWHSNLKDLVDIYMKNVPKNQKRDQFVICKIQIDDYVELQEAWHNFQPLKPSKWILKGNFCQNNKKYSKETRNTQCTAMAAICIGMKELLPVSDWSSKTLDDILDHGDKFYELCLSHLHDKETFVSRLLMVKELLGKYIVDDKEFKFEIDECTVNGNISYPDNDEIPNLKMGFKQFFEESDAGILTCRNISVAVWKTNDIFYYFDSHARNDEGLVSYYGTSIVMRVLTIEDLTNIILANLDANTNSQYNLSRVEVKIVEAGAGVPKPPLNHFASVNESMAILRASASQEDPKYKINSGKQAIPNALVAFGMTQVYPTQVWSKDTMDDILNIGDKLYIESMEAIIEAEDKIKEEEMIAAQAPPPPPPPPPPVEEPPETGKGKRGKAKKEEPPPPPPPPPPEPEPEPIVEEEDTDDVTTEKALKEFKIGVNAFKIELGEVHEGTFEDLKQSLTEIYAPQTLVEETNPEIMPLMPPPTDPVNATGQPPAQGAPGGAQTPTIDTAAPAPPDEDDGDMKQVILESEELTVAMWKDDGLYYVFDPKARDPQGQVYGKDEWSLPVSEASSEATVEEDGVIIPPHPQEDAKSESERGSVESGSVTSVPKSNPTPEDTSANKGSILDEEGHEVAGGYAEDDDDYDLDDDEEDNYESDMPPVIPKHSSNYWREQAKAGKAYTMRFYDPLQMIAHVIENIPPTKFDKTYKLTPITITNEPKTKDTYDPEMGPPPDKYSGDWKNFKEIEHGRWILRGTTNDENLMFPSMNRGRQFVAMSFTALAFTNLFSIPLFNPTTVDDILMYGDRLHTFTLTARRKELKQLDDVKLTDSEIHAIIKTEEMGILNTTKHFCLSSDKVRLEIEMAVVDGETNAQELEDELDVKRGLEEFFHNYKMGLLSAKDLLVAIWRRGPIFYMFDPHSRGPSGLACTNGVACITRYLDLADLADVFLYNLSKDGDHRFFIHAITINVEPCPREEVRKKKPKLEPTLPITSFDQVIPGKTIVRGTISQGHPMFGRQLNSQFAPMAFVALAMTLVHRCLFWTKPIIDEIITIGDQLYGTTLDELGFEYNPWEQPLTVDDVPTDFKIGALKVNCEVRPYDERGIIGVKNSLVPNLRQGLEAFFEENTHGIIETEMLTLAVWEETEPHKTYYMFDPSSRGPTGMPLQNGAACVITFDNPKLVADHFMSLIPDNMDAEFSIRPIEIVVGKMKTKGKKKKKEDPFKQTGIYIMGFKVGSPAEKKKLKAMERLMKTLKEEQRKAKLGRKRFYAIPRTEIAILKGSKHEGSSDFSVYSRNNQDIPICLTAYVMERLLPFDKWTFKIIDMVLEIGDQLYKDSYILYSPTHDKLGLNCVIREIVIKDVLVNIAIGRPVLISQFSVCKVETALELVFRQKNYCMIAVNDFYVAVFFKDEFYYLFDPHGINLETKRDIEGYASLLKFPHLNILARTLVDNYTDNIDEEPNVFTIILVAIKSIRQMPKRTSSTQLH